MTLGESALAWALTKLGVMESGGSNRGSEVEKFLATVRLEPGQPWCCAFVVTGLEEAASAPELADKAISFVPRTGSCLALWRRAEAFQVHDGIARPGDVYVLKHSATTGHVGFVEAVDPTGQVVSEISGNTNRGGSREGNSVWRHMGRPEISHGGMLLGYLRFV